jgi:hypothetical protein
MLDVNTLEIVDVDAWTRADTNGLARKIIRISWNANIGWGEYTLYEEDGEWKGDSERMDTKNEEKKFLRALLDKFIEEIEIVG